MPKPSASARRKHRLKPRLVSSDAHKRLNYGTWTTRQLRQPGAWVSVVEQQQEECPAPSPELKDQKRQQEREEEDYVFVL